VTSEKLVRDIRRATRKQYSAEEKIRIILDGLRGAPPIAELCRREGIAESMYYSWSKEFLEAGKRRLAGDSSRDGARRRFLLFDRSLGCRSPSLLPKQDTLSASRSRAHTTCNQCGSVWRSA
jgi:transposase-like protein